MLLNNFFRIEHLSFVDQTVHASISIEASHSIFSGHFPDQAIVPGVCMLEMLKETIEQALGKSVQLESAAMVKFLTMFAVPQFTRAVFEIQMVLSDDHHSQINATLVDGQSVFLKFKGVYRFTK